MIDLHMHSTYSDGTLTPQELLNYAEEKKLKAIALTDHDTVNGIESFLSVETDILKVSGVEISIDFDPGTFHLVGLFIKHNDENLKTKLEKLKKYRRERNSKLVELIKNHFGIEISLSDLQKDIDGEIGRPHIAKFLMDKGIVSSTQEAFDKYLGKGKPLYIAKKRYSAIEGIDMIKKASGISIIAHPITLDLENEQFDKFTKELIEYGLDGIEVFCSLHTIKDSKFYLEIAKKYNLFISAGSDFHGLNKTDVDLGQTNCPEEYQKSIYTNLLKYF
ncbi:PHP domain-containing protein [Deferribacter autotrophicus]|uniref:PHP domain-containing protein n=1 Tax=Deferribacter autotrophicus TaxID=500465 RepID=A0A5A8F5J2_9BACT|nr:PHP domain-containing protein [Deferribacter autotrophicus]KAA0259404.1 PHP domain-containing protein [Deferribacter autotrophicus]